MTLLIIGLAHLIAGFVVEGRERRRAWPLPVTGFAAALGIEPLDEQEQQ